MELKSETINFLIFVLVGIITGIIFDFFRAMRKVKRYNVQAVYLQDIIFFLIIGIVISSILIYKLEDSFRAYILMSMGLGIVIYICTISSWIVNRFVWFIKISGMLFRFVILPLELYWRLVKKIYSFLSNMVKKCCNKFFNVVSYFYLMKSSFFQMIKLKKR